MELNALYLFDQLELPTLLNATESLEEQGFAFKTRCTKWLRVEDMQFGHLPTFSLEEAWDEFRAHRAQSLFLHFSGWIEHLSLIVEAEYSLLARLLTRKIYSEIDPRSA